MLRLIRALSLGQPAPHERLHLGLDLGTRRIKIVVIGGTVDAPVVRWVAEEATPAGLFDAFSLNQAVASRPLRSLLERHPAGRAEVTVLLPAHAVRVRLRRLRVATRSEALRALSLDPALRIPGIDAAALSFACHLLNTPTDPAGDTRPVLGAAGRWEVIRAAQQLVSGASRQRQRVAAEVIALANLHRMLHPAEITAGCRALLIHVGYSRAELIVVQEGVPLLSHSLPGIETPLERARQTTSGRSLQSLELALGDDLAGSGRISGMEEALEEWLIRLEQEIRRVAGAAARELGGSADPSSFSSLRISGGAARVSRIREALESRLGTPVHLLDPIIRFPFPSDFAKSAPAFAPALGAALEAQAAGSGEASGLLLIDLGGAGDGSSTRSLPLREFTTVMCRDRAVRAAAAAATLLLVFPLPLEMYLDRRTARHEQALPLVEREARRLSEARVRLRELGAERIRLSSAIDELARLEGGSYAWVRLMDAAASALAEPCWLQGLSLEGSTGEGARTARIQGIAPSLEHVTRFERALRATGTIRGLTLSSSEGVEIAGHPLVRFSLVGEIAAEPRVSRTAVSR